MQSKQRVVVTGMGMLTPLGLNVSDTWAAICSGQSGISRVPELQEKNFPVQILGSLKGFDPALYLHPKDIKKTDPSIQYALAASDEAIRDSGLILDDALSPRFGVAIGSGIGGVSTILENHAKFLEGGARKVSPFFIPSGIVNMSAGQVSIRHHLKGPNVSVVTACTTGTHNIALAARMIAYGDADVMLAGGTEMANLELCIAGFASARALSFRNENPSEASRPWDKDRDGFVLAEGAGLLVLEAFDHAVRRGAHIYGEVLGVGMSADAHHITSPDPEGKGAIAAMQLALRDAEIPPEAVDYVNAHGTSTDAGDRLEALAICQTFGAHAYKMAISSTKSMTGHLLGAAGSIEAIFSLLAIRDNVAPPTINCFEPNVGEGLNFVPHVSQQRPIDVVLSNSFGFGGTNGSLIFRRV